MENTYRKGQAVKIAPEWLDSPEEAAGVYICADDEEKGRVDIIAMEDLSLPIPPRQTVSVEMIQPA